MSLGLPIKVTVAPSALPSSRPDRRETFPSPQKVKPVSRIIAFSDASHPPCRLNFLPWNPVGLPWKDKSQPGNVVRLPWNPVSQPRSVVPEQNDENICEIIFKPYRIFYRVKDEIKVVEVIRFWHAARDKPEI